MDAQPLTTPRDSSSKKRSILTKIKSTLKRTPSKVPSEATTPHTTQSRLGRSRTLSGSSALDISGDDTKAAHHHDNSNHVRIEATAGAILDSETQQQLLDKGYVEDTALPHSLQAAFEQACGAYQHTTHPSTPLAIVVPEDIALPPEPLHSTTPDDVTNELSTALKQAAEMERVIRASLDTTLPPPTPVVIRIHVGEEEESGVGGDDQEDQVQALQHQELRYGMSPITMGALYPKPTPTHPISATIARLTMERDHAVHAHETIQRAREDMARNQGQLKATIAKLEGIVASSDKRIRQQTEEIEHLTAQLSTHPATHPATHPHQITLERTKARITALQHVIQREAHERAQLEEFCATEMSLLWEQEAALRSQLEDLTGARGEHVLQLSDERTKVAEMSMALASRDKDTGALRAQAEQAQRHVAEQAQALQQAAANVRAAEAEVDMVNQSNEQYFRYINYIRGQLVQHAGGDQALVKLGQELETWCATESQARGKGGVVVKKESRGFWGFSKTPKLRRGH